MIQDPTDEFIRAINAHYPLAGKTILEIGCGSGRVTRDLAKFARHVTATDTDKAAVEMARATVTADNVAFKVAADGLPKAPGKAFDAIIYTLSLHHIPSAQMCRHMTRAVQRLKDDGVLIVVEPESGGSFNEAKRRFGAGSGDEGPLVAAARQAIDSLQGWETTTLHHFKSGFLFSDEEEFITEKLPHFDSLSQAKQDEITHFLKKLETDEGIFLESERALYLLTKL